MSLLEEQEEPNESSLVEIRQFIDSSVWRDMERLLKERHLIVTDELIIASDLREIGFKQGELASIQTMLQLPSHLLKTTQQEIEAAQDG